jgi:organic radical activating enzyme
MNIKISEKIFASFQGEANNAGMPSLWVRFFGCNLQCNGFNQADPTNPATYILPYKELKISNYSKMEDLPVFEYGCDSSYSWYKKYKHLSYSYTVEEIVEQLLTVGRERFGIINEMCHPLTRQHVQLCFTGGEPMLQQKAMLDIIEQMNRRSDSDTYPITIETNGTKRLTSEFKNSTNYFDNTVNISCSPKLFSVSGEKDKVYLDIIEEYARYSDKGCIKLVANGTAACWDEIDSYTEGFTNIIKENPNWSLWIMPVGATVEQQQGPTVGEIANDAMKRGYKVATRNHVSVYGNVIGS